MLYRMLLLATLLIALSGSMCWADASQVALAPNVIRPNSLCDRATMEAFARPINTKIQQADEYYPTIMSHYERNRTQTISNLWSQPLTTGVRRARSAMIQCYAYLTSAFADWNPEMVGSATKLVKIMNEYSRQRTEFAGLGVMFISSEDEITPKLAMPTVQVANNHEIFAHAPLYAVPVVEIKRPTAPRVNVQPESPKRFSKETPKRNRTGNPRPASPRVTVSQLPNTRYYQRSPDAKSVLVTQVVELAKNTWQLLNQPQPPVAAEVTAPDAVNEETLTTAPTEANVHWWRNFWLYCALVSSILSGGLWLRFHNKQILLLCAGMTVLFLFPHPFSILLYVVLATFVLTPPTNNLHERHS